MKLFADRVGALFTTRFEEIIDIAEQPGPGVLVMNLALTEIKMKKKRGLMGFTPGGALLHAATSQKKYEDLEQLAKKILLTDANLEIELVDGGTGELLAIRILTIEGKEKGREEKSWAGLRAELDGQENSQARFHKWTARLVMTQTTPNVGEKIGKVEKS